MQNVRIFFRKTGLTKYISHLDLMRCMTRAIRRSGIPVWYTEGYNPHLFMTFALPLSLGIESNCESFETRITEDTAFEEIRDKLNSCLPDGIEVISVALPVLDAKEIAFADYTIIFHALKNEKVKNEIEVKLSSDSLPAEKTAKQGKRRVIKTINLKDFVNSYKVTALNDKVILEIIMSAGCQNNINPNLFVEALHLSDEVSFTEIVKNRMMTVDFKDFR